MSGYGQSHAINKGFSKTTGEIQAYLNSDDLYEPGALEILASWISRFQIGKPFLVAGECTFFDGYSAVRIEKPWWPRKMTELLNGSPLLQPATFWSNDLFLRCGSFDENLDFCFDGEFFLRIGLHGIIPILIPHKLALFRNHSESKTKKRQNLFYKELIMITMSHGIDLGLSEKQKKEKIREIDKRRRYVQVFVHWKEKGRFAALWKFLGMIFRYPTLLFRRETLGMGRRLMLFRYRNVIEIEEFS